MDENSERSELSQEEAMDTIAEKVTEKLKAEIIERKFIPGGVQFKEDEDDKLLRMNGGYEHFYEFAYDLNKEGKTGHNRSEKLQRWVDTTNRVEKATGLSEGDATDGGYLVPETFRAQLLQVAIESSTVKAKAVKIPMMTNRVTIPAVVVSSHATTLFGGVTIYRPAEGGSKTASKPAFGKVGLTLHKLVGLVYGTDELLEDSPISLQPLLTTMFGQAIGYTEEADFLFGDGVNKALGGFSAANPCRIAQTIETGQGADTIVTENILKMWSRVHPMCRGKAVWYAHPDTFPQLATMSLAVGTGGIPVWMPAGGIAGREFETLMGRPIVYTEKMQTLGDAGDIGVADFSQYLIGEKGGIKTAQSIHLKFDYDETAFRFVLRYDGQPWWMSALTPRNGSTTLSPFVTLAERA